MSSTVPLVVAPGLQSALDRLRARADAALDAWLPPESAEPAEVHRALRYSLFGGGKRLRPALVLLTCDALGGREADALPSAAALECVHTYSLIHDDLPAMDDDDLRRGRATCHKAFDEATAILAGDALLTIAFELIARHSPPDIAGALCLELAVGAGTQGMVGGQVLDMRAAGAAFHGRPDSAGPGGGGTPPLLERIHRWKTAALFRASARMGAIAARAEADRIEAAGRYGDALGLAFQVADDILDVEGTAASLGKTPGKDAQAGKLTYPAVYGLEASRAKAAAFAAEAKQALSAFPSGAPLLAALADLVVSRKS